jgi:esterase
MNKMRLYFKSFGNSTNKPLLILHGLYGNSDNWTYFGKQLSDKFYVIIPDLRNHGKSPHSQSHNYGEMVNDIETLLTSENIAKLNILGHSMGGKLAMAYTSANETMINKLIVVDISPWNNQNDERNLKAHNFHFNLLTTLKRIPIQDFSSYNEIETDMGKTIVDKRLRMFLLKNINKEGKHFKWRLNLDTLIKNLESITEGINPNEFTERKIKVPALFLRGEKSDYIQLDDIKNIRQIFPNSQITSIPNAGHWMHAEQPELVIKNIRYFLENND